MSEHLSASDLRLLAQIIDLGRFKDLKSAAQAIAEGKPFGESSLDDKIVATFGGVSFTEANFRQPIIHANQTLKRHRNGGGWVPSWQDEADTTKPFVAETAYVGPWAVVYDNARVYDQAFVNDRAQVYGYAWVYGNARVGGAAEVNENALIFGTAQVFDSAWVHGHSQIFGTAMVYDGAEILGNAKIYGSANVHGNMRLFKGMHDKPL